MLVILVILFFGFLFFCFGNIVFFVCVCVFFFGGGGVGWGLQSFIYITLLCNVFLSANITRVSSHSKCYVSKIV